MAPVLTPAIKATAALRGAIDVESRISERHRGIIMDVLSEVFGADHVFAIELPYGESLIPGAQMALTADEMRSRWGEGILSYVPLGAEGGGLLARQLEESLKLDKLEPYSVSLGFLARHDGFVNELGTVLFAVALFGTPIRSRSYSERGQLTTAGDLESGGEFEQ